MARKKKVIITVAVSAAICGAVALGWHSLMSFDVTTDISDYIDTDEFEGTYGLRVLPDVRTCIRSLIRKRKFPGSGSPRTA